jgi:hypothetical protein
VLKRDEKAIDAYAALADKASGFENLDEVEKRDKRALIARIYPN